MQQIYQMISFKPVQICIPDEHPLSLLVKYIFQIPYIWQFKLLLDGFWLVSDKNGIPLSGNLKSVPGNCFQVLEFCLNSENTKKRRFSLQRQHGVFVQVSFADVEGSSISRGASQCSATGKRG